MKNIDKGHNEILEETVDLSPPECNLVEADIEVLGKRIRKSM